jgi:hypothetical protein
LGSMPSPELRPNMATEHKRIDAKRQIHARALSWLRAVLPLGRAADARSRGVPQVWPSAPARPTESRGDPPVPATQAPISRIGPGAPRVSGRVSGARRCQFCAKPGSDVECQSVTICICGSCSTAVLDLAEPVWPATSDFVPTPGTLSFRSGDCPKCGDNVAFYAAKATVLFRCWQCDPPAETSP